MVTYSTLARRLKAARQQAGLNQTEVAGALGFSRFVLSKIKNAERKVDSLELRRLAYLCGVGIDELLADDSKKPKMSRCLRKHCGSMDTM